MHAQLWGFYHTSFLCPAGEAGLSSNSVLPLVLPLDDGLTLASSEFVSSALRSLTMLGVFRSLVTGLSSGGSVSFGFTKTCLDQSSAYLPLARIKSS